MALDSTEDDIRAEEAANPEFGAWIDEEILGIGEEVTDKGPAETEVAMMDAFMRTFLSDTPSANPSRVGVTVDVAPGAEAQDESDTSGTVARHTEWLSIKDFTLPPSLSYFS